MKYYVSCTLPDAIVGYLTYEGMEPDAIDSCLSDLGATNVLFLDETTWLTNMRAEKALQH
jgi:hypothetical protein